MRLHGIPARIGPAAALEALLLPGGVGSDSARAACLYLADVGDALLTVASALTRGAR